jgi:ceramide glucosyltransferase
VSTVAYDGSVVLMGILLVTIALHHRALASYVLGIARRSHKLGRYPSLTVVRPIKGLDFGLELNLAAALDHGYPGEVEMLFVFDHPGEPGVAAVQAALAARKARPPRERSGDGPVDILFCGAPPAGMTGKLNAMMVGAARAKGELVVFADSDTRTDRHSLRVLVETLMSDPGAGSAFAPVYVASSAQTPGDAGYALMLNALYGPMAAGLAADAQSAASDGPRALPFIMGQLMVVRREALAQVGGVGCARGQLVDDMHIGVRLNNAGFRNLVSPHPVAIHAENLTGSEFLSIFARWIAFGRALPTSFNLRGLWRGLEIWLAAILTAVYALHDRPVAALLGVMAMAAIGLSLVRLHRLSGGAPLPLRFSWVGVGLLLLGPAVYIGTFLRRQVSWRGRTYRLDAAARLAT